MIRFFSAQNIKYFIFLCISFGLVGALFAVGIQDETDKEEVLKALRGRDLGLHYSGEYLKDLLEKATDSLPNISEIRGRGLLIAVEFTEDIAPELVSTCNELGLLLNPVRPNAIRLMPPLTVSKEEMDKAVELIVEGVKTILTKGKE